MTKLNQVYTCEVCGNIVEILHAGAGKLVCCGAPMKLLKEQSKGEYAEKHAPVVESIDGDHRVRIKIGSIPHPMEKKHYIEWIEILTPDRVLRKYLTPGEKPEKEFTIRAGTFKTRMYCNVHGLWTS